MASLTLTIGPLTSSITAPNARAITVLENFLLGKGYDLEIMTDQEQADAVMLHIRQFLTDSSVASAVDAAVTTARQTVLADPDIKFEEI